MLSTLGFRNEKHWESLGKAGKVLDLQTFERKAGCLVTLTRSSFITQSSLCKLVRLVIQRVGMCFCKGPGGAVYEQHKCR